MTVPFTVSCGKQPDKNQNYGETNKNKDEAGLDEDVDPLIPVINEYVDELASTYNFKGKTFNWMGTVGWQAPEVEDETGNTADDAMYFRQREIEEKFGLDWQNITAPGAGAGDAISPTVELIRQDVMAGTGAYSVSYAPNMQTQLLLINDTLMNLTDFSTLDLERPWWQKDLYDIYGMGGEMYFLTGPIVTWFYEDVICMVYNKQVAEDYRITGLYDLVRNKEWTFDKMLEVASVIPENANGSGAWRFAGIDGMAVTLAHGHEITSFDEDGKPYLTDSLPQSFIDIADKYSKIFGDDTLTINTKWLTVSSGEPFDSKYGYGSATGMFEEDRMLFYMISAGRVSDLREVDVDFGILPVPMGYADQDEYISYAGDGMNVFVPKSSKDVEMADVILEAMAALGYKYFKPTFYDKMLKSRTVKDYESKDMLDIIFASKKYDIIDIIDKGANLNTDGEIVNFYKGVIQESSHGMVSKYFIKSKTVNNNIKMILSNIEADLGN